MDLSSYPHCGLQGVHISAFSFFITRYDITDPLTLFFHSTDHGGNYAGK